MKSNQAKQQIRTPIELGGPLYDAVRGWVSHEALRKVELQRKLIARKDPPPSTTCSGSFTKSQGLPCVHRLVTLIKQDNVLQLGDFHCHWHLIRKDTPRLLLEPRRRVVDALAITSTLPMSSVRREFSGFELVEARTIRRTLPLCSKCHVLGHAKTSKECPLRYVELRALQTATPEGSSVSVQETPISSQAHSPPATTSQHEEQGLSELSDRAPCESVSEFQHPTMQPAARSEPFLQAEIPHDPPPNHLSAEIVQEPPTLPVDRVSPPPDPTSARSLRYDDPRAIYERYVKDRESWYKAQRPGTYVNNRMYRQARGLPLGFKKESYNGVWISSGWANIVRHLLAKGTGPRKK